MFFSNVCGRSRKSSREAGPDLSTEGAEPCEVLSTGDAERDTRDAEMSGTRLRTMRFQVIFRSRKSMPRRPGTLDKVCHRITGESGGSLETD